MSDTTTIQITKDTREKLWKLKMFDETYDDLLIRMINKETKQ